MTAIDQLLMWTQAFFGCAVHATTWGSITMQCLHDFTS